MSVKESVKDIVIKFLKSEGAAGLRDDEGCCSCEIDDLFSCCDWVAIKCIPMYRLKCENKDENKISGQSCMVRNSDIKG